MLSSEADGLAANPQGHVVQQKLVEISTLSRIAQRLQRVVSTAFLSYQNLCRIKKILTEAFGNALMSTTVNSTTLKLDNATASVGCIITPKGRNGYRDRKNLRLALGEQRLNGG